MILENIRGQGLSRGLQDCQFPLNWPCSYIHFNTFPSCPATSTGPRPFFNHQRSPICAHAVVDVKILHIAGLQKWLGLEQIPRGFVPGIYTILRKLPETRFVEKSSIFTCLNGAYCTHNNSCFKIMRGN